LHAVRIGYPLEDAQLLPRERGEPFISDITCDFEPPAGGATIKFIEWSVGCAYVTWVIPTQTDDDV